jgi:hypothetical protein
MLPQALRASGWHKDLLEMLRASGSRARRGEEETAEAFFPLRATTNQADRKRAMREQQGQAKLLAWPMLPSGSSAAIPSLGCPVPCWWV